MEKRKRRENRNYLLRFQFEAVREARDRLKARGLKTNHMLIRALPLTKEVRDFLVEHDTIYFVEQNRDAQMAAIIKDENPELGAKIVSILVYNGLPIRQRRLWIRSSMRHNRPN